jgi:hypothetical protein
MPPCDYALPDVHAPTGAAELIETSGDGCGAWFPQEFRLCATSLKGRVQLDVVRRDGAFYAQAVAGQPAISTESGRCVQGAFFHMQVSASAERCAAPGASGPGVACAAAAHERSRRAAVAPQEWKKRWDDGAQHVDPAAEYAAFRLDEDGIHRLAG